MTVIVTKTDSRLLHEATHDTFSHKVKTDSRLSNVATNDTYSHKVQTDTRLLHVATHDTYSHKDRHSTLMCCYISVTVRKDARIIPSLKSGIICRLFQVTAAHTLIGLKP